MTAHITKTWIEDGRLITQVIPESEVYKREWVGLTDEERENLSLAYMQTGQTAHSFVLSIEAGLKVKNT